MKAVIRRMGNSQGVIIPKPLLTEVGLRGEAEMTVENGALVLRPIAGNPRAGWSEAAKSLAESGDDDQVWPDFPNEDDAELTW